MNGAGYITLGSVIVNVGADVYADPGSIIAVENIFPSATAHLALVLAPVTTLLAAVALLDIVIHIGDLFGLPKAIPLLD